MNGVKAYAEWKRCQVPFFTPPHASDINLPACLLAGVLAFSSWQGNSTWQENGLTPFSPSPSDAGVAAFLHVGAQQSVDAGLISEPLRLVPFHYIGVDAQGELLLAGHGLQAARRTPRANISGLTGGMSE